MQDGTKIFSSGMETSSSRSAPPITPVASLYTLDREQCFGRPRRRLFSSLGPGPESVARKHALPPEVSERAELQLFQERSAGDKSGCWKFFGGRFALTQSCLTSCRIGVRDVDGFLEIYCLKSLEVLDVPAVHDIRGNQNFKRIADTRAVGPGEKRLWMKWCRIHIWIRLSFFAACKYELCTYSRIMRLPPKTGPPLACRADVT